MEGEELYLPASPAVLGALQTSDQAIKQGLPFSLWHILSF